MCKFRVGQKVVMFKQFGPHAIGRAKDEGVTLPVKGQVYTIREIEEGEGCEAGETFYLRFNEIWNGPHVCDGIEPSFHADLFRPVVERKSDISVFHAMLTPSKQKVDA